MMPTPRFVVRIRGLSKTFVGTRALIDVDLDLARGEIHALLGGNGSGKSTLIKTLAGIYSPDAGSDLTVGEIHTSSGLSPDQAKAAGVHVVHQDLAVFPDLSIAENIALGHGYPGGAGRRIKWSELRARTQKLIERFDISGEPDTELRLLSKANHTLVAIARALQDQDDAKGGVLILDEPTSALPETEADHLLRMLRRYASAGQAILYVSHRLDEALELADTVTILRDGRKVGTYDAAGLTEARLVQLMIGRSVDEVFPEIPPSIDAGELLVVRGLRAGPLRDVSFEVRPSEIVGVAGLLGSGRTELLRALFGDLPVERGEIFLEGARQRLGSPADAMRAGIAYIPEDRGRDAAFLDLPVFSNLTMPNVADYWTRLHMSYGAMRKVTRSAIADFGVKAASEGALLSTLSGGNQQKVIVARWLRREPKLLLLDEPTQGVDVGARADIYASVKKAVATGAAALLVASDLEELAHVSDRVIVIRRGRIAGELAGVDLTVENVTRLTHLDVAGAAHA
jgi:ribose transport system ATP-binding protein